MEGGQIKILNIDYDPEGSDTDRESITLESKAQQDIALKKYRLQIQGKETKKMIRGEWLKSNTIQTFT
jgi:hypothetical protein